MTTSPTPIYTSAISEIKSAILQSRYRAASLANGEMLMLYFRIGGYVSQNSRKNKWGGNAIETIVMQLQKELPGLRGFGARNMRNMRDFYEEWVRFLVSPVATGEILNQFSNFADASAKLQKYNSSDASDELQAYDSSLTSDDLKKFFSIGSSHHHDIFTKIKSRRPPLLHPEVRH